VRWAKLKSFTANFLAYVDAAADTWGESQKEGVMQAADLWPTRR